MTNTKTPNARPWDFTPPPAMNNVMSTILRLPVIHRLLSKQILLITFTGRKSGKQFTTPIGYLREGQIITLLTKRFRKWWHNFEQVAPVTVRIEGKDVKGEARALTDEATIIPIINHVLQVHPREIEIYGLRLNADGTPNADDVREKAPMLTVIQIRLI